MVLHYKRRAWYKQGMSIKTKFETLYKYGIGLMVFLTLYWGSMYRIQCTSIAYASVDYLTDFAQSNIKSRDHVHLHLPRNNQSCVHLLTHQTNVAP